MICTSTVCNIYAFMTTKPTLNYTEQYFQIGTANLGHKAEQSFCFIVEQYMSVENLLLSSPCLWELFSHVGEIITLTEFFYTLLLYLFVVCMYDINGVNVPPVMNIMYRET